jgi:membrane-bound metal-dependent hydrolase YbcI (DUF457 family)
MNWLRGSAKISWTAALTGAFAGVYSHVALDSIMHVDMEPLAPLSAANTLHHFVSLDALHVFCVATAAVGATMMVLIYALRKASAG